jgi:preprotein translocase SecE subunit
MRITPNWFTSLKRFLVGTYNEAKRLVWPTRPQTIRLSLIVLGVCVVLGGILTGVDYLLAQGLKFLLQ